MGVLTTRDNRPDTKNTYILMQWTLQAAELHTFQKSKQKRAGMHRGEVWCGAKRHNHTVGGGVCTR